MLKHRPMCVCLIVALIWMCSVTSASAALTPKINAKQIRDFGRITFSWPERVRFKVNSSGNTVTLTFNKPANIDLSAVRRGLSPYVIGSSVSNDGTRVTLTLNHDYNIRHFMSGNANGIDILSLKKQGSVTPQPPAPTPKPLRPAETASKPKDLGFIPPISPQKPARAQAPPKEIPAADITVAAVTPPPSSPPVANAEVEEEPATPIPTPPAVAAEITEPSIETTAPSSPAEPDLAAEDTEASSAPIETVSIEDIPAPPAISEEMVSVPAESADAPPDFSEFAESEEESDYLDPETASADSTDTAHDSHGPFIVTAKPTPSGAVINFPWRYRVGAAAFFRQDDLWVIFNAREDINTTLLESILPAAVSRVDMLDIPGHTVLRMETDGTFSAKMVKTEGVVNEWQLTLSTHRKIPTYPIMMQLRPDAKTPNAYVPVLEYGEPLTITDPVIGDDIIVTPFYRSSTGIYPTRNFVEFTALETAQGMAIIKKADRVRVTKLRNGLRVDRKQKGIILSKTMPALTLEELESLKNEYATLFPYEKWKIEPGTLDEAREAIEQDIIRAGGVRRNSLRLKLAQMFLGEGLPHETIGLLQLIRQTDPSFYKERNLAALDAAAHFLAHRYNSAIHLFNEPELKNIEEIKLWKEAMQVFQKSRPRFDYLDYYDVYIKKYPPSMREKLAILATDNYINRRSYKRALKTLDTLSETGIDPSSMKYVDYLLGKISAANGNTVGAVTLWTPLAEQDENRFVRARAEYSLVTLLYTNDQISIDEAINRLDRLRIVWRGDSLELGLLSYLGQLYSDKGEYLQALRAWRELTRQFPTSPVATDTLALMSKTFNYLFAEGGADTLEPLAALSTFYEFRELTPIGEAGDVMIQGLADRLAGVDLLNRAAALLEHQIKFRQEKAARSKLAAQLAVIYLLNKEPEKALNILELTGYGKNAPELDDKRRHLTAMALTELDEHERALEVLFDDPLETAKKLRLGIFWKTKDWPNIIEMAEYILNSRDNVTAPLNKQESDTLLQLAIAYVFERDNLQLEYLRNYFEPLLPDSATKDMFMFITDATGPIDPNAFGEVAKQINSIESFMQSYRDKVSEGRLSSVVN